MNQLHNYLTKFQNLYQRKAKISFTKFPLNRNKVYQQKFKFSLKLSCLQVLAPSPRDESNHRSIWHFSTLLGPTRQVWWDVKKWEKTLVPLVTALIGSTRESAQLSQQFACGATEDFRRWKKWENLKCKRNRETKHIWH